MNPDTVSSRRRRTPRTARHSACIVMQPARRQSLAQVTRLASRASAAPGWDGQSLADFVRVGWLRSRRSPSLARACQLQLSLKLEVYPLRHRKAIALLRLRLIPPIPLKGGYRRSSNITRDYAQLKSKLSAAPHNQRYVKWPRSAKDAL